MFNGVVLPVEVFLRILFERNPGTASLLRTPVHKPVLAYVQITASGATVPVVGQALSEIVLELVVVCESECRLLTQTDDLPVCFLLLFIQR